MALWLCRVFFGVSVFTLLGALLGLYLGNVVAPPDSKPRDAIHLPTDVAPFQGVCRKNKLLPNVYVLGAQKAGTTMMAWFLDKAGYRHMNKEWKTTGGHTHKEWHFFDHYDPVLMKMAPKRKLDLWLSKLPACGTDAGNHSVRFADYTPMNLLFTPHGSYNVGARVFMGHKLSRINLPPLLRYFYRGSEHVRFIAMVREPLSRMHSEMWMTVRKSHSPKKSTFVVDRLTHYLKLYKTKNVLPFPMWRGYYGKQVHSWLQHWPAWQFAVVPHKYMMMEADKTCAAMEAFLESKLKCTIFEEQETRNARAHPSLSEEVPENSTLRSGLLEVFHDDVERFKQVLLDAFNGGATLPALPTEKPVKLKTISSWLESGW